MHVPIAVIDTARSTTHCGSSTSMQVHLIMYIVTQIHVHLLDKETNAPHVVRTHQV